MKKEERRQRLSLTMLFALLVFTFLFITMLVIVAVILIFIHWGVLQIGYQQPMKLDTFIILVALVSIVAGTVLAATVGRYPLKPVNDIINAMNRLAAGDYKTRLSVKRRWTKFPVVQEFAQSFNQMATELENTEMLRADFIDNFSHEFKTPIVSIAGFAKLLRKGNLSLEEQTEYLSIIEQESLRLSTMATNVLNMTQVENRSILTDTKAYNLSEQLRGCALLLENKWSSKHLQLLLDFDEHMIVANEELMQLVWINLLDNAIKFSPENGDIDVTIAEGKDHVQVSVINYGENIAPESMDRIYQKFYQGDTSHAAEGNGIGLAIVKKVVELHEGQVQATSGDGRTTFTVTLPRRDPAMG